MSVVPERMTLTPIDRVLLRDVALGRIRDAIVSGELAPGAVVKDAELAARLGLSVAPVRTALARLADEGLVEAKPQSHTRVTPLAVRQVRDAAVVVGAMHEVSTREAVPALTADDLTAMREANAAFAAAIEADDLDAALDADDRLHDVLLARCGNAAVRATVDRFTPLVRRLERQRFGAPGHPSVDLHDRLIAACAASDVGAAVATTTEIWTALLSGLSEETPDGTV
jgi:DNA-binding GntR family transcriptional regulator